MQHPALRIHSPVARGGGAFVVHGMLSRGLRYYGLAPYNPWISLFPPLIMQYRDRRAALVHAPVDYALFCAHPGQPLVSTFHGFVFDAAAYRYASLMQAVHYRTDLRWFVEAALKRSAMITTVSHFLARRVREELGFAGAIRVIHNGVDVNAFTPGGGRDAARRPLRVLFVGNPTRHKGADLVPAILDRLRADIEFAYTGGLAGRGRGIRHARAVALGPVGQGGMPGVYRDADILLAPAHREGFGLAIAEAMACGLPVVATDCSAIPELVENGRGGVLCPDGDAQAFTDAIHTLADAPALRREMGQYNRARVDQEFSLDRMLQGYRELFTQVMDQRHPHGEGR